jgi:hypothetical protein
MEMEEVKVETPATPVLSQEQKLNILLSHRTLIQAQMVFVDAQRKLQDADKAIRELADGYAKGLGINLTDWSLNLDTLGFEPAKK